MRSTRERLEDILDQIILLETHAGGQQARYNSDVVLQTFCLKCIEVIGEAAFKLPKHLLARYPAIPWSNIIGTRHILVHDYFDVRLEVIWRVVEQHLSPLHAEVEKMLRELPADETGDKPAHG